MGALYDRLMETYERTHDVDGSSGERLAKRLDDISKIGLTEAHGSNRPGFSKKEKAAKELVMDWMKAAGLAIREDGAGNIYGRMDGKQNELPAILSGSHLDSVPNGGHFDGPLGVLSALEVVEAWNYIGYQPEKPFEVVVFTDEEGSRFQGGLNGSSAVIGEANIEKKREFVDQNGRVFSDVLEDVGLSVYSYVGAERELNEIEMFVEVHIEQGKRLEKAGLPCGIVSGIAGPSWIEFTFIGDAGHAGNTPMDDRKDALVAASEFITEVHKLPRTLNESAVATVGKQTVEPNGVNVIPGKVTLYVDIRDIYRDTRDKLVNQVINLAQKIASQHRLDVEYSEHMRVAPVPIADKTQNLLEESVREKGIRPFRLPSGAGHDAMIMGKKWPVAMLFVQSKDGISHNPAEWSDLNDCVQTIHVLKSFIEKMQG